MDMESDERTKVCGGCGKTLLQNGIHMGIPFAYTYTNPKILVCTRCYDDMTTKDNIQKDSK